MRNRAAMAAHAAVQKAVREGRLRRPEKCHVCSRPSPSLVLHHHSYEPRNHLDVVALCRPCHQQVHLGNIAEPLTGELRRGDRVKRVGPSDGSGSRPYSGAKWVTP